MEPQKASPSLKAVPDTVINPVADTSKPHTRFSGVRFGVIVSLRRTD